MSFKKALETAKKMQQNFEVELSDGSGGNFKGVFKILTGEEAVWTYRLERRNETEVSFQIIQNFRVFCASLLNFKNKNENGTEEILQVGDIIKMLYTPEELANVKSLPLNFDEAGINELVYTQYLEDLYKIKSDEEYKKLPLQAREVAWDLIYKGMYYTFDQDYIFNITSTFLTEYRRIRPNPVEEQFMASVTKIVNEAKAQMAERANESKSDKADDPQETENSSSGSETPTS